MQSSLNIRVGMAELIDETNITRVNADFIIEAQQISQQTEQLRAKLGKHRLPGLIIEMPAQARGVPVRIEGVEFESMQKNGKIYYTYEPSADFTTSRKKFQKLFSKLTELNNQIYLHVDLYNVESFVERMRAKTEYPLSIIMQKSQIKANLSLDPQFYDLLTELLAKISPKFAESPIMAMLPLLSCIQCDLEVDSLNQLDETGQKELFSGFTFEEPGADEQGETVRCNLQNQEKAFIYVSLGSLGLVRLEVEVRMLCLYSCLVR